MQSMPREVTQYKKGLLVSELYENVVIQGEGMVAGVPTLFVRLGGCDYRCSWCDSLYAVLPKHKADWTWMNPQYIAEHVERVSGGVPLMVTLSGGNPALQDCGELIDLLHNLAHTVSIETQGTKLPAWAPKLDQVTISPKPPSSGQDTDWKLLGEWLINWSDAQKCLKVVVFDDRDFEYARVVREYSQRFNVPMFVQAGTDNPYTDTSNADDLAAFRTAILEKTMWLGEKVIHARWFDVRVLPQIHALIHGSKRAV